MKVIRKAHLNIFGGHNLMFSVNCEQILIGGERNAFCYLVENNIIIRDVAGRKKPTKKQQNKKNQQQMAVNQTK
jgi:hypothetical protein